MFQATAINNRLRERILEIQALPQNIEKDALDIAVEFEPQIESQLGQAPSQASLPFEFATPKSKRFYFWAVRTGKIPTEGGRYKRSGKSPYGWTVEVDSDGKDYLIRIVNRWDKSRYVYGTLNATNFDTRVAGHINSGWQLAKPIAEGLARRMVFALINRVQERFGKL